MHNSSNFLYWAEVKDFLNLKKKNRVDEIINGMKERAQESGVSCGESEIISWKCNFEALHELLTESKVAGNAIIAFEFKVPVGGCRVDCMLFGIGNNGDKNVLHIELKRWSNKNVKKYFDHHTFRVVVDRYRHGTIYTSHPSDQVAGYHNCMCNYMDCFGSDKLQIHGMAYCYEYEGKSEDNVLLDDYYNPITKKYPLYCKDSICALAKRLNELLNGGNGLPIFNEFNNCRIGPTERLYDVASRMLDTEEAQRIFALVGNQIDTFQAILGAVKNTGPDQKTVIIVKGGPGTGKSVLAIKLLSELYKPEYNCRKVYYATRSSSLRSDWKRVLEGVNRRFGKDDASSLIQSTYDFKPFRYGFIENGGDVLLVDEAHRISKKSNDQTDSHRDPEDRSNLTQIMSMLYTSRVCVFFIDDKQAILNSEIGLSSEIRKAAMNYKSRIEEENNQYLIIERIRSLTILERERERLKEAISKNDQASINKHMKKINRLERECNRRLVWPEIDKVNVLEFELTDQFRCNGSNNYLQWIDDVLYNSKFTRTINLNGGYKFGICDTPQELVSKIRSLDSYARFADEQKEKLGDRFTYQTLQELARRETFEQSARLVAGWCWDWDAEHIQDNGDLLYEVVIPDFDFAMPWETQKVPRGDFGFKYAPDANSWCNQKEGVNQIGSIHSIQGWETDYVGVIIGPDLTFDSETGYLVYNPKGKNHDLPHRESDKNNQLIRNTYRVLLTRGKKGCYVFACDPKVSKYLKSLMNQ